MNPNTRYIVRHINYFCGQNGHEFVLVFENETVKVTDRRGYDHKALDRADFVGLVSKAPKTQWGGMVPLIENDGSRYVADAPTMEEAIAAVRAEAKALRTESDLTDSDPVHALEKALKGHDWTYMYSDDPRYYHAGAASWDRIQALKAKVDPKVVEELFAKYEPKEH